MERFIIIEIGSTNTKAYLYENNEIKNLGLKTIEFKDNYKKEQKILEKDKEDLYEFIKSFNEKNIYVFGTSIFRNITDDEKEAWKKEFKEKTDIEFNIVTADMENELTVYGVISKIDYTGRLAIMISGGGSTELSIIENKKIIEKCNSNFGTNDVTYMYPELKEDLVATDYESMLEKTKQLANIPKNKADLLVLAGGDFIYLYEELAYPLEKNKFYKSPIQPYCLDTNTMDKFDKIFFYNTSLEEINKRTNKSGWWKGARGMRLCVKSVVDFLEAKYIIPTRISMVYGIVEKIINKENI